MTRTETEWQARERELLEANNRLLERARKAEANELTTLRKYQEQSLKLGESETNLRFTREQLTNAKRWMANASDGFQKISAWLESAQS